MQHLDTGVIFPVACEPADSTGAHSRGPRPLGILTFYPPLQLLNTTPGIISPGRSGIC